MTIVAKVIVMIYQKARGKGKITWLRFKCRSRAVRMTMTLEMETLCLMKMTWAKGRGREKAVGRENGQLHNSLSQDLHCLLKVI